MKKGQAGTKLKKGKPKKTFLVSASEPSAVYRFSLTFCNIVVLQTFVCKAFV